MFGELHIFGISFSKILQVLAFFKKCREIQRQACQDEQQYRYIYNLLHEYPQREAQQGGI
jgi:hypothetical protein